MATIEKTLLSTIGEIWYMKYVSLVLVDIQLNIAKLTLGILSLQENIGTIFEYMRVLSSRKVNPLIIPPDLLRQVLIHVKEDMKRNPRLSLPEDPNVNIWNYYTTSKITPIMMQDFLLVILTIPLIDQSLEVDLYKVYNLPALHWELRIQFKYELEGEYLAISKDGLYVAIPMVWDVRICLTTECYICLMNQALYPVEKIEWCLYAIFEQEKENIKQYCTIDTTQQHANMAQSLDGYMWAVSPMKNEKI